MVSACGSPTTARAAFHAAEGLRRVVAVGEVVFAAERYRACRGPRLQTSHKSFYPTAAPRSSMTHRLISTDRWRGNVRWSVEVRQEPQIASCHGHVRA